MSNSNKVKFAEGLRVALLDMLKVKADTVSTLIERVEGTEDAKEYLELSSQIGSLQTLVAEYNEAISVLNAHADASYKRIDPPYITLTVSKLEHVVELIEDIEITLTKEVK